MEFKYSGTNQDLSKDAFQQIVDKKYFEPDMFGNKPVRGVGISFSKKERNINGFYPETLFNPSLPENGKV